MTILIDFHGVLTDGKLNMSHDGVLFESMHVRDTRAIRELIAMGYEVVIVTASTSKIIDAYCNKVGCEKLVIRDKSKVPYTDFIAIGDDVIDLPMLQKAKRAFCPFDADWAVRNSGGIETLKTDGGKGCIAEMIRFISGTQGKEKPVRINTNDGALMSNGGYFLDR